MTRVALKLTLLAGLLGLALPAQAARDVMLVLDNSGSMRRNDPDRMAVAAVREFIEAQPTGARVGIVLFSEAAELVAPLTRVDLAGSALETPLTKFDYRGRWTQIAAGVERALYELRQQGRADVPRAIVLMTDGLIDTGDAARDAELRAWLEGTLVQEAQREGIRVYGVAFTERADYRLLQALASSTQSEYFRVLSAESLSQTMGRIEQSLSRPPPAPMAAAATPDRSAADATVTGPVAPPTTDSVSGMAARWPWVLLAFVLAGLVWKRGSLTRWLGRKGGSASAVGPHAVLVDVSHPGGPRRYPVTHRPLVIGRKAGTDANQDYVVVPEKTVGRWHATVLRRGQGFVVRDEQSANGTFVNGERVQGEAPLRHGDMLRAHSHTFEFQIPDLVNSENTILMSSGR